jgi:phage shock protein PspC (stress-responsive transcriptional regulator)
MLGGVAGGIARYLSADVTLVRILIAALAVFTGAGVALYIAAWLLLSSRLVLKQTGHTMYRPPAC